MILEQTFQLVRSVERVVEDRDGAQLQNGVKSNYVLRAVRRHDGHLVTRAHAECAQTGGGATDLLVHLREGLGLAKEVSRWLVRVDCQVVVVNIEESGISVVKVMRGPFWVELEPFLGVECRHGVQHLSVA